ncbi:MAG: hypothetical protein ICV84_08685, partial [Flavisolibacter sp.]|nr:hypothetical protein [Flavisolibacter sp.]
MSVLKLTTIIACLLCLAITSDAQVLKNISKKIEDKVNQRVDRRIDEKIDEELDKVEGKNTKVKKDEDGDVKVKTSDGTKIKMEGEGSKESVTALTYSSKYDFVPGEKVVAFEDFSKEAIGEFPTRWNTNGSAEVVTLNKKEGKWLKINHEGYFFPEFITNIPENSTLEFDLGVNMNFDWGSQPLKFDIVDLKNREGFSNGNNWNSKHSIELQFHPIRGDNYTGEVWLQT